MSGYRAIWLSILWVLLLIAAIGSATAGDRDRTHQIKAAFVLNFLKFAEWPAEVWGKEGDDLILSVIGVDPINPAIHEVMTGKIVQGRKVRVRVYSDTLEWQKDNTRCHAIFLTPTSGMSAWQRLQPAITNRAIVSISELQGFCAAGGMLNLFEQDERMRFEANPEAAQTAGLKLRAELLKLAVIVKTEKETKP